MAHKSRFQTARNNLKPWANWGHREIRELGEKIHFITVNFQFLTNKAWLREHFYEIGAAWDQVCRW